jgi:CheY-like chemotaxis protein
MALWDVFKKKTPPIPPAPKLTILIVDDEQYLREFYQELLIGEGYNVITAVNGQEGINLALQKNPQLILLDINMPVLDGLQTARKLQENPQTQIIPIIFLTNAGSVNNMDQAKFNKAVDFLIKSNTPPEVVILKVRETLRSKSSLNS